MNVIIGSGPSGMACSYTLSKAKQPCLVYDKDDSPGGLCRTLEFSGYLFDIGGHRFLSKSEEVNNLWREVLRDDLLRVKRLSRIYYRKKYFNYPLSFLNTFYNLGPIESVACILNYLWCKHAKPGDENTFEGWITNHFGKRLYKIFFEQYTKKVWAVACKEISADWAQQRIQGLSLKVAIQRALLKTKKSSVKTLSEEFLYPEKGPGEFYARLMNMTASSGGSFDFNKDVVGINHDGKKVLSVEIKDLKNQQTTAPGAAKRGSYSGRKAAVQKFYCRKHNP